jgi:hypothetical protein
VIAQQNLKAGWPVDRFVAKLAGLAMISPGFDREDEGFRIIGRALRLAEQAASALVSPLRCLQAGLIKGAAVNAFKAKDWDTATERYVVALDAFAQEGLIESALEMLARAEDVAFRHSKKPPVQLAIGLAACGPRLVAAGAARLDERLHYLWLDVVARTISKPSISSALIWTEIQAAKGGAFASMLNREVKYEWRRDPEAIAMLAKVEQLRAEAGSSVIVKRSSIGNDIISMGYFGTTVSGAEGVDNPLKNLEQHFDTHVRRRMMDGHAVRKSLLTIEELKSCLGSRTVFLSQFVGKTEEGRPAVITHLLTETKAHIYVKTLSLPDALIVDGDVEMNWFAKSVVEVREKVLEDPGPAEAIPEAIDLLSNGIAGGSYLIGESLGDKLREFRNNGKDHLCIHPHGPLHFHPQHLIGLEGKPLASDWIITYLPHSSLLRKRNVAPASTSRIEVVAIALDFQDSVDGEPIPNAVEEARAVAGAFGGSCLLNRDATKARLLEALTTARRVHLTTHGSQEATAPMFQRLYMHPDEASDGKCYAFEVIGLDLENLDLVTLGACETSLGRFDIGDTLRGLTANLFVAGVSTVIATLWPVADDTARFFFESLYRTMSEGALKLDAFGTAQLETKKAFPCYRDWGSFQYTGRW